MFMKTIAVGPLEPVGTGATVALFRRHCNAKVGVLDVARFAARVRGARRAIVNQSEAKMETKTERECLRKRKDTQVRFGDGNFDSYKGQ
jgi:hypothetical protein